MNDVDGISGAGFLRAKWLHLKAQMQEEIRTGSELQPSSLEAVMADGGHGFLLVFEFQEATFGHSAEASSDDRWDEVKMSFLVKV